MAKGDLLSGGTATVPQYGGQGQPNPAGAGASKSMNDILALLQHLGIGAHDPPVPQQGQGGPQYGGNNPQFGSNMMAGMRKANGGDYGNMGMQRGWGIGVGNPHNSANNIPMNPQGMTRAPQNPIATFPETGMWDGRSPYRSFQPPGWKPTVDNFGTSPMPSLLPSGGGGTDWQGIPGITRQGSNLMRGGQSWGHVGNNNQAVWNNGMGPFDIQTMNGNRMGTSNKNGIF